MTDDEQDAGTGRGPSAPPTAGHRDGAWAAVGRAVVTRPKAVLVLALALVSFAGLGALFGLGVRPGYVDLLSPDSPAQARYLGLLEEFGNVEALHVVVESSDPAEAAAFVDDFGPRVEALVDEEGRPLASGVLWRVDLSWFVERLPAYLPPKVLGAVAAEEPTEDLAKLVADPAPDAILRAVAAGVSGSARGSAAAPGDEAAARSGASALASLLAEMERASRGERASVSTWLASSQADGRAGLVDRWGHVKLDGKRLLVVVTPADVRNEFAAMQRFLAGVKRAASEAAQGRPGVEVQLAGAPVLLVDEMRAVRRDATLSSIVSLVLVAALYFVSFRPVRHVAAAVVAGLCGLVLAFGAAWLLVGYLNLFSAVFAAILIGIGLDFGIHLVNFHGGLRRAGVKDPEAIVRCVAELGPPTAIGALTSAAAFFATLLSDFRGFSQLGLISGAGVVLCLLTALTLLPALLALDAHRVKAQRKPPPEPTVPWSQLLLALPVSRPRTVLVGGLVLVALAGAGTLRLHFDYNLLNLQPAGTEAVALAKGSRSRPVPTHFAYSVAASPEEARALAERYARLPSVGNARSIADVLPPERPDRAALEALASRLSSREAEALRAPVSAASTREALRTLVAALTEAQDLAFDAGLDAEVAALDDVMAAGERLAEALEQEGASAGLTAFRDESVLALNRMVMLLPELAARGVTPSDLPSELSARLVGKSGRFAVVVEPARPAWTRPELESLVADLRTVDPDVTGPPVQILEVTESMRVSLQRAALVAFVVIVLIVAVSLRRLAGVVAALVPVVFGFVVMLGVMGWLGVALNPANLVVLPLLLGIGVDSGIHVAHRWLETRDVRVAVHDVGHAVVVTSLTTLVGFGGLLIASHRGIRSLGVLASVGTCAMLFTSIVLLPATLRLAELRRRR